MFDQSLALRGELRGELSVEGEDEVPSESRVLGEGHPLGRDQLAVPGAATQTHSQAPQALAGRGGLLRDEARVWFYSLHDVVDGNVDEPAI